MSDSVSKVNLYNSIKSDPRVRGVIWILTSPILIAFGIKAVLRHTLDDIGWLIAPVWGFILALWLYRLHQAFQDQKYQTAVTRVQEGSSLETIRKQGKTEDGE
jgi:hypothetical protein